MSTVDGRGILSLDRHTHLKGPQVGLVMPNFVYVFLEARGLSHLRKELENISPSSCTAIAASRKSVFT